MRYWPKITRYVTLLLCRPNHQEQNVRGHRNRKRCGTLVIQDLEITRSGIGLLVARGWLDAEARDDPAEFREALVKMVNTTLNETPGPPPFWQKLKSVFSFGLF